MTRNPAKKLPYDLIRLDQIEGDTRDVVTGWKGDLEEMCRRSGVHTSAVTPYVSRWGHGYVIQWYGDGPNTVSLWVRSGSGGFRLFHVGAGSCRYQMRTDLDRFAKLMGRIEADYPPGSVTGALAATLDQIMQIWSDAHHEKRPSVSLRLVDEVVAAHLGPFIRPWADPDA